MNEGKTLAKLLEPDEEIIARIPFRGTAQIGSLIFGLFILVLSITIFGLAIKRGSMMSDFNDLSKIPAVGSLIPLLAFLTLGPYGCFMIFNSKMVFTNKRLIKDSWLWADVYANSYANIEQIKVENQQLVIKLVNDSVLKIKTEQASALKGQLEPLIATAIATQISSSRTRCDDELDR